jgi:hypothetical protein
MFVAPLAGDVVTVSGGGATWQLVIKMVMTMSSMRPSAVRILSPTNHAQVFSDVITTGGLPGHGRDHPSIGSSMCATVALAD